MLLDVTFKYGGSVHTQTTAVTPKAQAIMFSALSVCFHLKTTKLQDNTMLIFGK